MFWPLDSFRRAQVAPQRLLSRTTLEPALFLPLGGTALLRKVGETFHCRSMIVMARPHACNEFGGPVHSLNFILGVPALGLRQSGRRCRRRAPLPKGRR